MATSSRTNRANIPKRKGSMSAHVKHSYPGPSHRLLRLRLTYCHVLQLYVPRLVLVHFVANEVHVLNAIEYLEVAMWVVHDW